jgi:hypothetical protein
LFKPARGSQRRGDDADDAPSAPEPAIRWPPRFRWLKHLTAAYLVFVTCLALLYWGWTAYSHRQLAAAIAAVHARREPALPEDFDPPPIPDDENAAVPLRQAAALFKRFESDAKWEDRLSAEARTQLTFLVRHLEPVDAGMIKRILGRHDLAMHKVRDARRMARADWGIRMRRNIVSILVPHLSEQRGIAQFASAVAIVRHAEGDHAEMLELLRDVLAIAHHAADGTPFEVGEGMSCQLEIGVTELVEQFAPTLDLRDSAPRAAARALQIDLLDERRRAANHLCVAHVQRAASLDVFVSYFEGKGALTEPMYRLDAARAIRARDADVAAARCESFAGVTRILPKVYPEFEVMEQAERRFSPRMPPRLLRHARINTWLIRSPQRAPETYFRALADRRAAAVLLAIRMYELDHGGALPASWADLVGEYLPAIPNDPFAAGGAALRFVRRGDDEIMLYSVGADGVDDGGAEVDKRGRPRNGRYGSIDLVYHYRRAGTGPATTPSR